MNGSSGGASHPYACDARSANIFILFRCFAVSSAASAIFVFFLFFFLFLALFQENLCCVYGLLTAKVVYASRVLACWLLLAIVVVGGALTALAAVARTIEHLFMILLNKLIVWFFSRTRLAYRPSSNNNQKKN